MQTKFYICIKYFSVTTALTFYCDAKHSDILRGSVMLVAICSTIILPISFAIILPLRCTLI